MTPKRRRSTKRPEPASRVHRAISKLVVAEDPLDAFGPVFAEDLALARASDLEGQRNGEVAEDFAVKELVQPLKRFLFCGDVHVTEVPFVLADGARFASYSGQRRVVVLNSSNPMMRALMATLDRMKTADPDRYDDYVERLAPLLADVVTWPLGYPVSQLDTFGIFGSEGYPTAAAWREQLLRVPMAKPDDKLWTQDRVRLPYSYTNARMMDALAAELRFLFAHPLREPAAEANYTELRACLPAAISVPSTRPTPAGHSLILYSPNFARFVAQAAFPDPNESFHFAVSLLLRMPIVDRTGIIVDPAVRVRVVHALPTAPPDEKPLLGLATQCTTQSDPALRSELARTAIHVEGMLRRCHQLAHKTGLEATMDHRARSLFEQASRCPRDERRVDLFWSGGIGSTGALVAFLKIRPAEYRKANVTLRVRFNKASVREFPELGRWLLTKRTRKFKSTRKAVELAYLEVDEIPEDISILERLNLGHGGLTVTGLHCDQIFGSVLLQGSRKRDPTYNLRGARARQLGGRVPVSSLSEPWEAQVRAWVKAMKIVHKTKIPELLEKLKEQASACPFEIVSTFDWLWWASFSMTWQPTGLRMLTRVPELSRDKAERLVHFYSDDAFQLWAMSKRNHALKFPKAATNRNPDGLRRWSMYKALLKAYIAEGSRGVLDQPSREQYFLVKTRKRRHPRVPATYAFAMDDQYRVFSFGGFSLSRRLLHETYGDDLKTFLADHEEKYSRREPVPRVTFGPAPEEEPLGRGETKEMV